MVDQPNTYVADPSIGELTILRLAMGSVKEGLELDRVYVNYARDLQELVRWLALAYNGNTPTLPVTDAYGSPLEANIRLRRTWEGVIGEAD